MDETNQKINPFVLFLLEFAKMYDRMIKEILSFVSGSDEQDVGSDAECMDAVCGADPDLSADGFN